MLHTPKEVFLQSEHKEAWKQMVEKTATFEQATLAALNQMQHEQPHFGSPEQSAYFHHLMVGARQFLDILTTIYVPEPQQRPSAQRTLNYQAGV